MLTHTSFLKIGFGRDLFAKQAPFSDVTFIYSWKSLMKVFFFSSESGNTVKILIMSLEKRRTGLDTYHRTIASTLRRASPSQFDSGCNTRESV